ncbi:MAG: prepilin-type N-terminal cleavage/methylation domain-containing protein [Thiobacillaceae bacterium]|nr:prepilin-type N-terminal cleavage/methylation domain-containing protein [Thiobacillaceae bacterium]
MNQPRGFTLIELAIVLVIITILIGGLAMPLSAQIQARRVAETRQTMQEAREAIIGFAMTHQIAGQPYLPCPDTVGDGIENRDATGICSSEEGLFPWVTMGTAGQDAWGNRLRYRVTAAFADGAAGFSNTDVGNIQVCSSSSCAPVDIASNVPVVLVSHGPNGRGGRSASNNTLAAPSGADELENTDADISFVSHVPAMADAAGGEFDDLIVWISDSLLRSRVCPAGGCP